MNRSTTMQMRSTSVLPALLFAMAAWAQTPVHNITQGTNHATIQAAEDAATAGDSISIDAGTYVENVKIDVPRLTLHGAGQDLTIVVPAISVTCSGGSPCTNPSNVFKVYSDSVSIQNLTVDGNNPAISSGVTVGGSDIDARNGIIAVRSFMGSYLDGFEVANVTVRNTFNFGISGGADACNFHDNTVENVQGEPFGAGLYFLGWHIDNPNPAGTIANNTVSKCKNGIVAGFAHGPVEISGNTITLSDCGILANRTTATGAVHIDGNNVSNGTLLSIGIEGLNQAAGLIVENNIITGQHIGLLHAPQSLPSWPSDASYGTFLNNEVNNCTYGFYQSTQWGAPPDPDPGLVETIFENNSLSNCTIGLVLETDTGDVRVLDAHQNSITGSSIGVHLISAGTDQDDLTCNWWGTASGAAVDALVDGPTNFVPFDNVGNDTSPDIGYQPEANACGGACIGNELVVEFITDDNPLQLGWEFRNVLGGIVASSGPSNPNSLYTESVCLSSTAQSTCYTFSLFDSFGDGISGGNWELRTIDGQVILRDLFDDGSQSPSATPQWSGYGSGHSFCLPLGPAHPKPTECGIFTNGPGNKVYCNKVTGATLYQFEFTDPDAGYTRRQAQPTNYIHFWDLDPLPLTPGVTYFARVRTNVDGPLASAHFGGGCEMGMAPTVPCTQLISAPNYGHSCNETRAFGQYGFIYATPVPGADAYEFRIHNLAEGYDESFTRTTYILHLKWNASVAPPLVNGSTYNVDVNVINGGVASGFCGNTCMITIDNGGGGVGGGGSAAMEQAGFGVAALWPNPVRGGQVHLNMGGGLAGSPSGNPALTPQHITVEVMDLYGKQVFAQEFSNSGERFNTILQLPGNIATGVYLVNITVNLPGRQVGGKRTVQRLSVIR